MLNTDTKYTNYSVDSGSVLSLCHLRARSLKLFITYWKFVALDSNKRGHFQDICFCSFLLLLICY